MARDRKVQRRALTGLDEPTPSQARNVQLQRELAGLSPRDQLQRLQPPRPMQPPVQQKSTGAEPSAAAVKAKAAEGVSGGGQPLPFLDKIQSAMPGHDLSNVQAHVGGKAGDACSDIGASAYATGNNVAFKKAPDLHTAAHEAAHVVQQRAGVQLSDGVGKAGDGYERQADKVADRVAGGGAASGLIPPSTGLMAPVVQRVDADDLLMTPDLSIDSAELAQEWLSAVTEAFENIEQNASAELGDSVAAACAEVVSLFRQWQSLKVPEMLERFEAHLTESNSLLLTFLTDPAPPGTSILATLVLAAIEAPMRAEAGEVAFECGDRIVESLDALETLIDVIISTSVGSIQEVDLNYGRMEATIGSRLANEVRDLERAVGSGDTAQLQLAFRDVEELVGEFSQHYGQYENAVDATTRLLDQVHDSGVHILRMVDSAYQQWELTVLEMFEGQLTVALETVAARRILMGLGLRAGTRAGSMTYYFVCRLPYSYEDLERMLERERCRLELLELTAEELQPIADREDVFGWVPGREGIN